MALSSTLITQSILAAGPDLRGPNWNLVAVAVGAGVFAWALSPSSLALGGVTTGATGSGAVLGKLSVVPAPLPVPVAAAVAGLLGLVAPSVARAVGLGVAAAFNASAQYRGASVGVGSGTDLSKVVVSNGPALVASLAASAASSGLRGVDVGTLCAGLGTGLAALLGTATGVGVVAGPVGPAPGVGTSISGVF